jgi:SAM-dependent methyltransferase
MFSSNANHIDAPTGADTYSSAMSDAKNYIGWILDSFGGIINEPILEIGVGHGSYAEALRERGEYVGVDIDQHSVDMARRRFPNLSFHVADITQNSFVDAVGENRFGCIICLNVLEHIDAHASAVQNLGKALKSGGHLAIIAPALNILSNDLDRLAGHLRRYRREEIGDLLHHAGLEVVRSDYFNPVGGLGWMANRLVKHHSLNDAAVNGQIRLFDRWAMPASRLFDPLTRRFFGQSVIAMGRKP